MQDGNENEGLRSQLYERFREALVKPVGERFFEEDELIEIFDYAGDVNDDYVRWEVLFCGERLYPESDELRVRRAILYRETMPQTDAAADYLRDNAEGGKSVLWKIEQIAEELPDAVHAPEALDGLLASKEEWGDEEMIRLVKLASMLGCTDWLLGKQEELRARTGYLPVLLYELGLVFMDSDDLAEAAPFFEELTRLEPFEASYWALSCSVLARLGRTEEAREAFEFASGLDISDPEAPVLLAQAAMCGGLEDLRDQAIEKLEADLATAPEYFRAVSSLATLYLASGRREDAERTVMAYAQANPRVRECVNLAANLQLECLGPVFTLVMHGTGGTAFSAEDVIRVVEIFVNEERFGDARTLAVSYMAFAGPDVELQILYAECSFRLYDFQGVMDMFPDAEAVLFLLCNHRKGLRLARAYRKSLEALGREAEAKEFAEKAKARAIEGCDDPNIVRLIMDGGLFGEL